MIKFVSRTRQQCGDYGCVYYVLDVEDLSAKYIVGGSEGIYFYSGNKALFNMYGNPDYVASMLGGVGYCISEEFRSEYMDLAIKNHYSEDIEFGVCVDPRVIMASVFVYLAAPSWDFIDILNEAMNPLPPYEEAEKWLWDNDFTTPKHGKKPIGRVIEVGENPAHFVNIPPKIKKALLKIRELDPEWHDD